MSTLAWYREEHGSFRYHVDHDDGTFDENKLPAAEVKDEARRTHKSVEAVIASRLGLKASDKVTRIDAIEHVEPLPEAAELPDYAPHTHAEFDQLDRLDAVDQIVANLSETQQAVNQLLNHVTELAAKEHSHAELSQTLAHLNSAVSEMAVQVSQIAGRLAVHDHKEYAHGHEAFVTVTDFHTLVGQVGQLAEQVKVLSDRPIVAEHHHTEHAFVSDVEGLRSAVEALESAATPVTEPEAVSVHVHGFNRKGAHKNEWVCNVRLADGSECGEAMTK